MLEICFDQGKIKLKDPRLDVIVTYDLRAIRIVGLDCTPPNHIKFGVIMKKTTPNFFDYKNLVSFFDNIVPRYLSLVGLYYGLSNGINEEISRRSQITPQRPKYSNEDLHKQNFHKMGSQFDLPTI